MALTNVTVLTFVLSMHPTIKIYAPIQNMQKHATVHVSSSAFFLHFTAVVAMMKIRHRIYLIDEVDRQWFEEKTDIAMSPPHSSH